MPVDNLMGAVDGLLAPGGLGRAGLVAAAGCLVLLVTLPPERRRWAVWPLGFLLVSVLPLALAVPVDHPDATAAAQGLTRFLLLGAILQAVLLFLLVSCWERIGRPLPRIFLDVLLLLAVGAALVAVLYESGVRAESLFTGSAVLTAVLGFALRDTLGNVFAGLAIHAEHPFEVGDWIQYDTNQAHIGKVVEINWRATKVITLDEAYVIIPNGQLALASIRNFTKPDPWSRRSLFVVTPYDVPPQRVQTIILDAIRGSFGVLDHPAPSVVTNAFTDRGVEHWVRLFTTAFDRRDRVDGMARDRIWYALARHGIELPVATHAIRLTPLPPPEPERPEAVVSRRAAALRRVGLLDALDEGLLERLAADSSERVFAAGEPIIREGEPGASMFVILSGRVDVTTSEAARPPVRVAALTAGDYVGEMSLMTGAPRVATVTALEETRVMEVDKEVFRQVLERHPELVDVLGQALHERMAERQRAVEGRVESAPEVHDIFRKVRDFFSL